MCVPPIHDSLQNKLTTSGASSSTSTACSSPGGPCSSPSDSSEGQGTPPTNVAPDIVSSAQAQAQAYMPSAESIPTKRTGLDTAPCLPEYLGSLPSLSDQVAGTSAGVSINAIIDTGTGTSAPTLVPVASIGTGVSTSTSTSISTSTSVNPNPNPSPSPSLSPSPSPSPSASPSALFPVPISIPPSSGVAPIAPSSLHNLGNLDTSTVPGTGLDTGIDAGYDKSLGLAHSPSSTATAAARVATLTPFNLSESSSRLISQTTPDIESPPTLDTPPNIESEDRPILTPVSEHLSCWHNSSSPVATFTSAFAYSPTPVSTCVSVSGHSGECSASLAVSFSRAQTLTQSQLPEPVLIKSIADVEVAITRVFPNTDVNNCRWLRLGHSFNTHFNAEADGLPILVSVGPNDMNSLLRSERLSLESEAVLLNWIAQHQPISGTSSPFHLPPTPPSSSSLGSYISALSPSSDCSSQPLPSHKRVVADPRRPAQSFLPSPSYTSLLDNKRCGHHSPPSPKGHKRSHSDALTSALYANHHQPQSLSQPPNNPPMALIPSQSYHSYSTISPSTLTHYSTIDSDLHSMFPVLQFHGRPQPDMPMYKPYNIKRNPRGITLSQIKPPLSSQERQSVDFQIGTMLRKLAKIQSPTGQFGPVTSILNGPPCQSRLCFSHAQDWTANTWELTFHRLLEGALRDSEDLYVTLPFSRIRANAERFLPMLRHVTRPSLVCVDAGIDGNTLALREEDIVRLSQSEQARMASIIKDAKSRMTNHMERSRTKRPIPMYTSAEQPSRSDVAMYDSTMAVTGLVDWSMCFFGDPLFAEVLSHCPSVDLLQGFNETPSSSGFSLNQDTTARDDTTSPRKLTPWSSLVEDRHNAHVRILLYECYHAISRITAQFVRPKTANTATELAARRRLMQAITKLDGMDDDGLPLAICGPPMSQTKTKMSPNHPRPSGEMSPAKRPRSVSSDDDDAEEGAYTRPYGFKKSPPR